MSKIARKPIIIPENAKFSMNDNVIDIEGPMGKLSFTKHQNISIDQDEGLISIKSNDEEQIALSGTTRACLLYTSPSPRDRTRSRMPSSA